MRRLLATLIVMLMGLFPLALVGGFIGGLPCWSYDDEGKHEWYFSYAAEFGPGTNKPYLSIQKQNDIQNRYRVYDNVEQAARDATEVCQGNLSFQSFRSSYNLVKMKPYQHTRDQ